jgi:hypothetical protein
MAFMNNQMRNFLIAMGVTILVVAALAAVVSWK